MLLKGHHFLKNFVHSHIHTLTQVHISRHGCEQPLAQNLCSSVWADVADQLHSRTSAFEPKYHLFTQATYCKAPLQAT